MIVHNISFTNQWWMILTRILFYHSAIVFFYHISFVFHLTFNLLFTIFATKCRHSSQVYSIDNELRHFIIGIFRFFEIYSISMNSEEKVNTKIFLYYLENIITNIVERKLVSWQIEQQIVMSVVLLLAFRYIHRNAIERYYVICLVFTNEPFCIKDGRSLLQRRRQSQLLSFLLQFSLVNCFFLISISL